MYVQREPPSNPPAYARFIPSSATRRDLRPAVILVASFSCIYGIIAGAAILRRRNNYDGHLPGSLETIYVVLSVLYFACSAVELFGVLAAWRAQIKLVRTYFYGSVVVGFVVTAAEVLRLVVHFTQKSSILKACQDSYSSDVSSGNVSQSDVTQYCNDSWRNAGYLDVALLVFSLFVSFFFASLAASYLHQLKNPALLRTQAPSAAYAPPYGVALEPYPSQLPPYGQSPYAPPAPHYPPPHSGSGEGVAAPGYDNPNDYKAGSDNKDDPRDGGAFGSTFHPNPFEDEVEHQNGNQTTTTTTTTTTTLLIRRPGETVEEFEQRQHEHDLERDRRAGSRGDGFGESTETVTLEGGGARI
ncbi:hypothetical protein JCM10212_000302 [Sporobolomyces blumeae]